MRTNLAATSQRAIDDLLDASIRVTELPLTGHPQSLAHQALACLHGLLAAAAAAELAGASFRSQREATAGARAFFKRHSGIIAHTQDWPRGYPGDFEVIEVLMDVNAQGQPGTIEAALDGCILQLPIVWQHRAKVAWQARLVRRGLADRAEARVLSIACGGSRDLLLLEPHELARLAVALVDFDGDALALSRARLDGKVRELACVQGNVLRLLNRLRAAGPFDVILIGGLLDYLPERAAVMLLQHALAMLAPRGVLGATNLAAGNPWRPMLELIADWTIIERDAQQMSRLLALVDGSAQIALDDTRLTWLATAWR